MSDNEENAPIPLETKILVVDDLSAARRVLTRMLNLLGIRNVEAASNYDEAVEKLKTCDIEIVISDLHLGSHKALDILKYVREDMDRADMKFMIVTSDMDKESFKTAILSGATSYLLKPFNRETLVTQLKNLSVDPEEAQEKPAEV